MQGEKDAKKNDKVKEPEKVEEPPKPKARVRGKTKAKASPEKPSPKVKAKAKAKGKAKAKAKASASVAVTPLPVDGQPGSDDEEEVKTPRRRLFHEDSENSPTGEASPGDDFHLLANQQVKDPRTGEMTSMHELFEAYAASRGDRQLKRKRSPADPPSGDDVEEKEGEEERPEPPVKKSPRTKAKAKAKGKAKAKAAAKAKTRSKKPPSSPSIKKEQNRRKKKAEEYQCESAAEMEDKTLQAVLKPHLKAVQNASVASVKEYLYKAMPNKFKSGCVVPYWTRSTASCGITVFADQGNPKSSKQHFAYFSFKIAKDWNINMAAAYAAAFLMVSGLRSR